MPILSDPEILTLNNSGKSRLISPDSSSCLGKAIKCPNYSVDLHVLTQDGPLTETISTRRCRTNLDDVSTRPFKARSFIIIINPAGQIVTLVSQPMIHNFGPREVEFSRPGGLR